MVCETQEILHFIAVYGQTSGVYVSNSLNDTRKFQRIWAEFESGSPILGSWLPWFGWKHHVDPPWKASSLQAIHLHSSSIWFSSFLFFLGMFWVLTLRILVSTWCNGRATCCNEAENLFTGTRPFPASLNWLLPKPSIRLGFQFIGTNDQGNFGKQGITRENLRDDEERNLTEKLLSLVLDESSRPTKDLQTDLYVNFRDYSSPSLSSCLHHEFLLISSLLPAPLVCAFVFVILAGWGSPAEISRIWSKQLLHSFQSPATFPGSPFPNTSKYKI